MSYACRILADSKNAVTEKRITTFEVTFPRIVLAEFNTHRMLSRNSASSRAIPVAKMIERVEADPFIPVYWGKNQKGMQAAEELSASGQESAKAVWLEARDMAVSQVKALAVGLDVHKQIANRLLEPFMWHTVIVTATEWQNFFNLRTDKAAQPEIQRIARMMEDLYLKPGPDLPKLKQPGEWHLPLVEYVDSQFLLQSYTDVEVARICSARCGRVSYLTHDGVRDPQIDLTKADELQKPGHMSPFEHAAQATPKPLPSGNFTGGWAQYRKRLPNEAVFAKGA